MSMTLTLLLAVQILSALSIIMLVLLQQGKGADMGSAFGSGSAGSLFGATGAANFLSRATKWAAVVFFVATGSLGPWAVASCRSSTVPCHKSPALCRPLSCQAPQAYRLCRSSYDAAVTVVNTWLKNVAQAASGQLCKAQAQ